MYFAKNSRTYGDLYVPAFTIAVGSPNLDILAAHGLAATSVSVDLELNMGGTFRFSIPNTFQAEHSEFRTRDGKPALDLLTLGKRVWIRMGYGDSKAQKLLLSGYITGLGTSFTEGGSPSLEVSGTDSTYLLTLGTKERQSKENMTVKDMVGLIVGDSKLAPVGEGAPAIPVTLNSDQQTDLLFLGALAKKYNFTFYAPAAPAGDRLHVGPHRAGAAPIGALTWGVDLLSFSPVIELGKQISKVTVHGWDEVAKKPITGVATREPPASGGGTGGGSTQKKIFGKESELELNLPVKTQKEAKELAEAELAGRAREFARGTGETFGFPELLPDTNVELKGLGARFSRTFYVTKTVHRFEGSGYRTRFDVERTAM